MIRLLNDMTLAADPATDPRLPRRQLSYVLPTGLCLEGNTRQHPFLMLEGR